MIAVGEDTRHLREVLSLFASGVVVVTAVVDDVPVGLTCQSFTSLSLDPPMVLFCTARSSRSWPLVARASHLCINVLSADQHGLSDQFARSGADKYAGVAWTPTPHGAPSLDGAAAHLEVSIAEVYAGGDHHIVTCDVVAVSASVALEPLVYHRSSYRRLDAR